MTLIDAKKVRDEVKQWYHCIVPLGYGPDGYFARIFGQNGVTDFHSRSEARKYRADALRKRRKSDREFIRDYQDPTGRLSPIDYAIALACGKIRRVDTRSPLDRMIDAACGMPDGPGATNQLGKGDAA